MNYSTREFRISPQNWSIVQDKNGVLFVGNQAGLMQYDGVSWDWSDIPNQTVKSMTIDDSGRIFIGGRDEIGFLATDEKGVLHYRSLLEHLDDRCKNFYNVMKTHWTKQGIYFQSRKFLFRWDGREMKVWDANDRFYLSFVCKGKLFIRQANTGLMQIQNDELILVPRGELFIEKSIYMIVPYDDKRMLIGTGAYGFYLYNDSTLEYFPTKVDLYLKNNKLYHGIRLSSGDFALATLTGGLVIIDFKGRLKAIFNSVAGLQDDNVKHVFEDFWGNVWLGLERGVSRIEYSSPFSFYDARSGLKGLVLSITKHRGDLYAGTTRGLYRLGDNGTFTQVQLVKGQCRSLLSTQNALLVATEGGVFWVKNNLKKRIVEDYSYILLRSSKDLNRIWVGTRNGLVSLYRNQNSLSASWEKEHKYMEIDREIFTIAEDKKGNIWLGTSTKGVWKVEFPVNGVINPHVVKQYGETHNLPNGEINVFQAANHVMFATIKKGILRFNEKSNCFIPDFTLGTEFADGSRSVFRIAQDRNRDIWFHSRYRNFKAIPGLNNNFTVDKDTFKRLPDAQVNIIYPDPEEEMIWFGGNNGLIRYHTGKKKRHIRNFKTLIRQILVNGKPFTFERHNVDKQVYSTFPVFTSREGNISFQFSSPFFEGEDENHYHCILEGNDAHWSPWTRETRSVYTNLEAGVYTFRVRSRNVYGNLGEEATFRFRILPPWYKTWWAIGIYILVGGLLMYLGAKWRVRKLEKEKQHLEGIVSDSTKKLKEKNRQLEKQTHQLKDQARKLEEMAAVKSRFFANISHEFRTPLTLIKGPIELMQEEKRDREEAKQLDIVLRNVQKLLILINQLLDLSRFDSGKLKLNVAYQNIIPFFKGIIAAFDIKAVQKKIKLSFTTKTSTLFLYFDGDKIEQILGNLLVNALKFTPRGGKVTVSVEKRKSKESHAANEMLELSIKDTGVGIPREQLPHIFERFFRVERPVNGESLPEGTGIGLALTKELVELHGGRINVHSDEDEGTEFVILLPLGDAHLKPEDIVTVPDGEAKPKEAGQMASSLLTVTKKEKKKGKKETEDTQRIGEKNVILVVEDNVDMLNFIGSCLKPFYSVVEALDGKEGIEKAKKHIPDLVISDIMMPKLEGDELCRQLKNDIETSHIPIILLTARASEESIIQGYETGADDYIVKPFNRRILLSRIKNLIALRRQLQLKIQKQHLHIPEGLAISPMDKEFLVELQAAIEANMAEPEFNMEKLRKKLYMAKTSLTRKVKALTGETPNQYLQSYRLERADQLLKAKQGNVTEIAYKVGFSSSSYFARCYKAKFNRLPSTTKPHES